MYIPWKWAELYPIQLVVAMVADSEIVHAGSRETVDRREEDWWAWLSLTLSEVNKTISFQAIDLQTLPLV